GRLRRRGLHRRNRARTPRRACELVTELRKTTTRLLLETRHHAPFPRPGQRQPAPTPDRWPVSILRYTPDPTTRRRHEWRTRLPRTRRRRKHLGRLLRPTPTARNLHDYAQHAPQRRISRNPRSSTKTSTSGS